MEKKRKGGVMVVLLRLGSVVVRGDVVGGGVDEGDGATASSGEPVKTSLTLC
jgi:hypothetical protein